MCAIIILERKLNLILQSIFIYRGLIRIQITHTDKGKTSDFDHSEKTATEHSDLQQHERF